MERILVADTPAKTGEKIRVAGWVHARRDHGKLMFIDLRDRSGLLQVVLGPQMAQGEAGALRSEWVVEIEGTVAERPKDMVNPDLATGEIELKAEKLKVLNRAKTPPLPIDSDGRDIGEETRLKYRYLDLRRERLQKNLRMRGKVIQFFRNYLYERDFVEIETPFLAASTPEGARDYVVPSRLYPGKFYALPQSPQQFKQLLMVAGFERYFQIARAMRDEDPRADRQPEHTQLDLEMSFTSPEEVMSLIEGMVVAMMKEIFPDKKMKIPWPRISYREAMSNYGTDKPDIREKKDDPNEIGFAWVVNFPYFERDKKTGEIQPVHHMFVLPKEEDIPLLDQDPYKVTSTQYDWVSNGYELASGSMRINNAELQMKIFKILGMSEETARKNFGHLLDAFESGAPPHGGIAPGIDRLLAILMGEPNIREVIAFPKTGDARDLMTGAPSEISKEQLKELGLEIKKKKAK